LSDWPWVLASFTLTWVVLAVYAVRINRRLARARDELETERKRSTDLLEK
jgi:CcmD family protein